MGDFDETISLADACDNLAILMDQDRAQRTSEGVAIFSFIEHLNNGETPAMALALVKNRLELPSLAFLSEEYPDEH